jgi:antitoxin MazE
MRAKIQKWGNSLAVRIPQPIAQDVGLYANADIEMSIQEGRLVLALTRREYTLEELTEGITPENRHAEVDLGPPVGCEIL